MEFANIEELLKKYINAETTLEEEAYLKAYFSSEDIAPHLAEYQIMFTYFKTSKKDRFTKNIKNVTYFKRNKNWFSIAASIIIVISIYVGNHKFNEFQERKKAKKTLAHIAVALKMMSSNLKKGNQSLRNLYIYEDSVNKIFKTKKINTKQNY
tara:strand:+ start:12358 stop:12816 length:459 start_codon:yes stop_codon:yes gene_type:complete